MAKKAMEPTMTLRWAIPSDFGWSGQKLQQLWTDGDDYEWRDVTVYHMAPTPRSPV